MAGRAERQPTEQVGVNREWGHESEPAWEELKQE